MFLHYDKQKFELPHCFCALGQTCKFVLRCKNIYRIDPRASLLPLSLPLNLPNIDLKTVALFAEDLGCDVVGSSAKSSFSLTVKINFSGQAEISQLDLKLQQEQNELFF